MPQVGLTGQPSSLETAHPAGRGGLTVQAGAIRHGTHRRIVGETIGVIHVLIPRKTSKHGLAEQAGRQVTTVPASAAFRQRRGREVGQPKRVLQLTIRE